MITRTFYNPNIKSPQREIALFREVHEGPYLSKLVPQGNSFYQIGKSFLKVAPWTYAQYLLRGPSWDSVADARHGFDAEEHLFESKRFKADGLSQAEVTAKLKEHIFPFKLEPLEDQGNSNRFNVGMIEGAMLDVLPNSALIVHAFPSQIALANATKILTEALGTPLTEVPFRFN